MALSWLRRRIRRKSSPSRAPRHSSPPPPRPSVDSLESRPVSDTLHWGGGAADNRMSSPGNYVEGRAPRPNDDLVFDGASGRNPGKNAELDPAFGGSIHSITLAPAYTGMMTVQRSVTV